MQVKYTVLRYTVIVIYALKKHCGLFPLTASNRAGPISNARHVHVRSDISRGTWEIRKAAQLSRSTYHAWTSTRIRFYRSLSKRRLYAPNDFHFEVERWQEMIIKLTNRLNSWVEWAPGSKSDAPTYALDAWNLSWPKSSAVWNLVMFVFW